jgi:hypothetical protein
VPTRAVRGTLLVSSRAQLRRAGLFEAYRCHLSESARTTLDGSIAASWIPIDIAHAHFAAVDALDLLESDILAFTRLAGEQQHHVFLSTALRLVRATGLTPWTALPAFSKIWDRVFEGGALGIQQTGPKDARVIVAAHPLLRHRCHRIGARSHIELALSFCAKHAYVREAAYDRRNETMTLTARWL